MTVRRGTAPQLKHASALLCAGCGVLAIPVALAQVGANHDGGEALGASGQALRAISDFDQAIRINPDGVDAYLQRAFLRQKQGDHAGALEDYDRAIALNPRAAEAFRGRGYVRLGQQQIDVAIADLSMAIELDPKDALAFALRSSAYAAKKDLKRANADAARARQLNPAATGQTY